MKKILVIGYSGFVGPYIAKEFINNGYTIFACDITNPTVEIKGVTFFQINILNFEEVKSLLHKVKPNFIINLAAISSVGTSWKYPQKTIEVNVIGSLNLLEATLTLEEKPRVLFVGSSEEYLSSDSPLREYDKLNSNNPYGISKLTQEKFAELYRKQHGLKIYCVRPFNHTGIGQSDSFVLPSFCKQVAEIQKNGNGGTIYVGNLSAIRDFSDVRDIVKAYRLIIESDNDEIIYNVGSGETYSLLELLEYIISLSNQKISIVIDKTKFRPVDSPYVCCDYELINKNLGWSPKHKIKDTLVEMYEYYLSK